MSDKSHHLEMYRRMLRIRRFEEEGTRLFMAGKIPGAYHSSIGHEAAIVGACMALRDDDTMTGTHRSHGHPIGKGADLKPLMAELMGKSTGICKGRGGSMHLADRSVGIVGESAIVGGGIPIATGCGLGAAVRRTNEVSLCFFGDGAVNQGTFHESLNMASLWKLPVVYLCENNGYAISTSLERSHGQPEIAKRAAAYGIPGVVVDGQDVRAVHEAAANAVARARRGEGPTLIEARTYRFDEHNVGLIVPGKPYRAAQEIEQHKTGRDPVALYRKALLEEGISEGALTQLESEVAEAVAAAIRFGEEGPLPDPSSLYDNLYTPTRISVSDDRPAESRAPLARMSYLEALVQAQMEEMENDERVILMGEDIAIYGGGKLTERFDSSRVWSMPISETSFTGVGIGAAINGLRPIVDLGIASFMYLASDQVINQASKLPYMTGGQIRVPMVIRCCMYYGASIAAQHSDRPYPLFMNVPGLVILSPTSAADIKGLLKSAVRDDNPVLIFEDTKLWPVKGEVPVDTDYLVPIGKASIRRPGTDVTLMAIAGAMRPAMDAAEALSKDGISVEVIDPRTLKPLDMETLLQSVAKTGRLVLVENAHRLCGLTAEIAATVCEEAFGYLKKPIQRLTAPDVHVPFSPVLEQQLYPGKDKIMAVIRKLL